MPCGEKNLDDNEVFHGSIWKWKLVHRLNVLASEAYYCGKQNADCRCGKCTSGICGPTEGCPCDACYAHFKWKRGQTNYGRNSSFYIMFPGDEGKDGLGDRDGGNTLYCGRKTTRESCLCGSCDKRCGPCSGCPCLECTITQLKSEAIRSGLSLINSSGHPVWKGAGKIDGGITGLIPRDLFYCGQIRDKCLCGRCDKMCGPCDGCPCDSCLKLINANDILIRTACRHNWLGMQQLIKSGYFGDVNAVSGKYQWTALSFACWHGQYDVVASLLKQTGTDINCRNSDNMTPLHHAAKWGHIGIVVILVGADASIDSLNNENMTPCEVARLYNKEDVVAYLDNKAYLLRRTPEEKQLEDLISNNDSHELPDFIRMNHLDVNSVLWDGTTPLCRAVTNGNIDVAESLITCGANVDMPSRRSETPLYIACKLNHFRIVEVLLARGANCNAPILAETQWAPLHVAVNQCNQEIVLLLLKSGADPRCLDFGFLINIRSREIKYILDQWTKKIKFDAIINSIITNGEAAIEDFEALTDKITSVNDLRRLYSAANAIMECSTSITEVQFNPVLKKALQYIIDKKLALNNEDVALFSCVLRRCKKRGILSKFESLYYEQKAVETKIIHNPAFIELLRQVQDNTWRLTILEQRTSNADTILSNLVQACRQLERNTRNLHGLVENMHTMMLQNQERETVLNKQRRRLRLVSMALFIVGGTIIREAGEHIIDLSNATELAKFAVESTHLKNFVELAWDQVELKEGVDSALNKIMFPKEHFVTTLQTCIRYDDNINLDSNQGENRPLEMTTLGAPNSNNSWTNLIRRMTSFDQSKQEPEKSMTRASLVNQRPNATELPHYTWLRDINEHYYHLAVESSQGDLKSFKRIAKYIDQDINQTILVRRGDGQEAHWSIMDLATYLGYMDIVEHLLDDPKVILTDNKATYVIRAQKRKNELSNSLCHNASSTAA